MALHRRAAKRDRNEPAIILRLEMLGCIVWRVSEKGLPDLIVLRAGKKWLADVKGPKEKPTPAQEKAWEEAATKARCAVFILRTPEDAAAMLNNALQPWEPEALVDGRPHFNGNVCKSTWDAAERKLRGGRSRANQKHLAAGLSVHATVTGNYTPPRSTTVKHRSDCEQVYHKDDREPCTCGALDAAQEAGTTFAPAGDGHRPCARAGCTKRVIGSDTCMEHDP